MSSAQPRTPPLTPRKQATREKILEAARTLFFDQGFDRATVEQIAEAAGTRRSTLYTHFRDKDEMLAALMDDYLEAVRSIIAQLPSPSPSYAEVDAWVRAFAELAAAEQVPTVLLMQASSSTHAPESVVAFGAAMLESLAARLPCVRDAVKTPLGVVRVQAVLRQLGWALVHYIDDPDIGRDHLTVAAEWLTHFVQVGAVISRQAVSPATRRK